MSRSFVLRYGESEITFTLPEKLRCITLLPSDASPQTPSTAIAASLAHPVESPRLKEIARGKQSAAILIPGKARIAGACHYVPALIRELNEGGIEDRKIEVILADGTHDQHLQKDIGALLGDEIIRRVRISGHDPRNEKDLEFLGTTSFGTPVHINRRILEADVKIATGRIVPHYFAGFSGGRKALIPGVAGFSTIAANHKLTLDPVRGIHPAVACCSLERNPVHLDMVEGARMVGANFSLNTVLNALEEMVGVYSGDLEAAHQLGCKHAGELLRLAIDQPVDAAITSAGGAPYDGNFMQSLKAVLNIQDILRPGGAILWIAQCSSGIHPGFLEWAQIQNDEELQSRARTGYNLTAHNTLLLRRLLKKCNVALFSNLPAEIVQKMGMLPVSSVDEGLRWITEKVSSDSICAVVPRANILCATLAKAVDELVLSEVQS
ncbi:nickel-dependent lactate racemase [bacterium]|nr:nickel-dependent lactate racemase [bacterium]MCI0605612.1 nickel-dependent lactate racemase [bacterium]